MSTESPEESGGVHWELGEARRLIVEAQEAGDVASETVGWLRLADALVNAASSGAARELVPMLVALRSAKAQAQQAHTERRTDAIIAQHTTDLLIDQAEIVQGEQGRQAARLGLAEAAILALALARAVSSADRQLLTAQIALLTERVTLLEASERASGEA